MRVRGRVGIRRRCCERIERKKKVSCLSFTIVKIIVGVLFVHMMDGLEFCT